MNNTAVIDQFLNVFTQYIDSGFGLVGGDVRWLSTTLIVIDMTLAGLFWAMAGEEDILARLIKKTLYVGFFAFVIGNFNGLCKVVYESFSGLGLEASGSTFSAQTLLQPGKLAQVGIDAGKPILAAASSLTGYVSIVTNAIPIFVLLVASVVNLNSIKTMNSWIASTKKDSTTTTQATSRTKIGMAFVTIET